jgi:hypothetical protein
MEVEVEPVPYRSPVKRRRGSESDSTADAETAHDDILTADDAPPYKRRRDGQLPSVGRLSLDHLSTTAMTPDSPSFDDDDDESEMEDADGAGLLHPLVAEHLRRQPPLIPPLPNPSNALVLYQPILRPIKPDEVVEEDDDGGEEPIDWPGKRPRRNASTDETIELDEHGRPYPSGRPPAGWLDGTGMADSDPGMMDGMEVDE